MTDEDEDITRLERTIIFVKILPVMWFLLMVISPGAAMAWVGFSLLGAIIVLYPHRFAAQLDRAVPNINVDLPPTSEIVEVLQLSVELITVVGLTAVFFVAIGLGAIAILEFDSSRIEEAMDDV